MTWNETIFYKKTLDTHSQDHWSSLFDTFHLISPCMTIFWDYTCLKFDINKPPMFTLSFFRLTPKLETIEHSLKLYVAHFGIQHGVLVGEILESQSQVLDMHTLFSRISILQEQTVAILTDDISQVRHIKNDCSDHVEALQELVGRYLSHLRQTDIPIEDVWMQIFLEQAVNSPITQRALTYWQGTHPKQKRFLQTVIPSYWIRTPVVFQTLCRGIDILPHSDGMLVVSEFNIQYFDFQTGQSTLIFSLSNNSVSNDRILKLVEMNGQHNLITTVGLWTFKEIQLAMFDVELVRPLEINRCERWQGVLYVRTFDKWQSLSENLVLNPTEKHVIDQLNVWRQPQPIQIEVGDVQLEVATPNYGLIQIFQNEQSLQVELNGERITAHLHHGGYLGLVSQLDIVILDVAKLRTLFNNPIGNSVSVLYGSVQSYETIVTITGLFPMDERHLFYWTYQGAYGHRTNIEICVYDTHEMEDIYCGYSQDLDEIDDVVIFEKDIYCDDEIPFIAWITGGHRSLITDFDDVPDFASVSPYASSEWPYKPEGLEKIDVWSGNSNYAVKKNGTFHTFAQNDVMIGIHIMPFHTSWVCTTDSGDLIFCSSAKIFHVRPFTATEYERHLFGNNLHFSNQQDHD